jgi:hypothetical protein
MYQAFNHAEHPLCNTKLAQPVFYADPSELTLASHIWIYLEPRHSNQCAVSASAKMI